MIIYEAADGLILQTSAWETIRLATELIARRKRGVHSLMPAGLLDGLEDTAVADLFAYLDGL